MKYLAETLSKRAGADTDFHEFILDTALDGLWLWDPQHPEDIWISPKYWQTLGYSQEEVLRLDLALINVCVDDPNTMIEGFNTDGITPGKTVELITRWLHKSGKMVWLQTRGKTILGRDSKKTWILASHTDVTDLKTKEEFLYQCNSTAQIGYWEVDLHRGLVQWSQITKEIHEVPDDYVPDMNSAIAFIKEGASRDLITKAAEDTIQNGIPYKLELQMVTAKGRELWTQVIGKTLFENGKCIRFYGTFQDITESKLAKIELERTVLLLNEAQRMATMGGWQLDLATNKVTWTEELYRIHEVEPDFDCNLEVGLSFYHPDDRDSITAAVQNAIHKREPYDLKCKLITAKGNQKWVCASGYPEMVDGKVVQLVGMFQDVSNVEADKQAIRKEQMFSQQIIQSMSDGFAVINPKGVIVDVNDAMCTMTGFSREEFIGSVPPYPHWPKDDHNNQSTILRKVFATGSGSAEHDLLKKNGEKLRVIVSASSVKDTDGAPLVYFGLFRDISERKKTEDELHNLVKVTKDQNDRLNNFAHIVSHNLRTNAGNVQSLITMAMDANPALGTDEYLAMTKIASAGLMETIESLDQVLRMEPYTAFTAVDLNHVVEHAILSTTPQILDGNIRVINEVAAQTFVMGIPAYLDSIVMNLLTNGIRYRDPSKEAYVRFSSHTESGHEILEIEDNGLGIDLKLYGSQLFGLYKSFHNHPDSHGIGLFITKNQVEALGGKIEVESQVGVGTTFRVYLKRDMG